MLNPEWVGKDPTKDEQIARRFLFHDCSPEVTAWALTTIEQAGSHLGNDRGQEYQPAHAAASWNERKKKTGGRMGNDDRVIAAARYGFGDHFDIAVALASGSLSGRFIRTAWWPNASSFGISRSQPEAFWVNPWTRQYRLTFHCPDKAIQHQGLKSRGATP